MAKIRTIRNGFDPVHYTEKATSLKTLLIFIFTLLSLPTIAQYGDQTNYLVTYGQVWGFLKYFHPKPSEQNWDNVLLKDYERILNCTTDSAFNTIISSLINNCGDFTPKNRSIADSLKFEESFEWITTDRISIDNQKSLVYLLENKPSFKNNYITETPVGNPKIINELEYDVYSYMPNVQFLALTRYWNTINYYCPNRDLIPRNWNEIYKEYVADFLEAKNFEAYYFAVRKLTAEIRDGHGFIRTENDPMQNFKFAPFYCVNVEEGYFITIVWQDSLQPFHLQKMDRIVAINGIPIEEKMKEIGTYVSTSNDYYLSKSTYYLRIYDADSLSITVEREGELLHATIPTIDKETLLKRYQPSPSKYSPPPYTFTIDSVSGKNYGYIDMKTLRRSDITRSFKKKLYKTDQLIIDMRNYPNWTLLKLSKVLLKGKRKFAKFKKLNFDFPGSYEWAESQTIGNNRKGYKGAIYVLVDYNTMSQAEYTVMALQQHPNTIVIGGQTAGADGNISEIPLPFGIRSVFSGLGVFYPNGSPTQQVGIKRNHKIVLNKSYLEQQNDVIREKALELIRN